MVDTESLRRGLTLHTPVTLNKRRVTTSRWPARWGVGRPNEGPPKGRPITAQSALPRGLTAVQTSTVQCVCVRPPKA